jgi:ribosomal-protein-alanine N-acetyltransferase
MLVADYTLRSMQVSDLDTILAIESDVYEYPWTRGNFEDSLNAKHQAWMMMQTEQVIGYAVMMTVLDEAHLFNISIAKAYQKQGLGYALLNDMIIRAKKVGAKHMFLEVRASNVSARQLYEKIGFDEVHVRRGYYQAKAGREDAVLMRLDI